MEKSSSHSTKHLEDINVIVPSHGTERVRQITKLNQDLSKDCYRTKYWELARRLAAANTGEILLVQEDYALWLQEYEEDCNYDTEEAEFRPVHDVYSYNSQEYAHCAAEVDKAIRLHRANLLSEGLMEEQTTLATEAAKLGFPSNLYFAYRDNDPGPSCQTWIIGAEGAPRIRDYEVGNPESREFYEGWVQLLPREIIASWKKDCISGPHYFGLKLYVNATSVSKNLSQLAKPVPSSKSLKCLSIDSEMPPLNAKQQDALRKYFSIAQLECLGNLQANIERAYRKAVDPIYGNPSPDIAGGWLGLMGIKQTFVMPERNDSDESETSEEVDEDEEWD